MTHTTNLWKRITSFLLALVMVLGMLPVGGLHIHAHAAEAVTMTGGEVLYLKPNSNWLIDNARFAAYFFGDGYTWTSMEAVPGNEGYYQLTVPTGSWTNVIFCRMNPTSTQNDWGYKWNQTGDLTYDGVNNLFTVPADAWDGASTGWSQWTPAVSEPEETRVIYVNESSFDIHSSSDFFDADRNQLTVVREELENGWVKYTVPASARYYLIIIGGGASGDYPELPANADTYDPTTGTWSCSHPGYGEGVCNLCGEACAHEGHGKESCALCGLTEGIHSYDETTHLCACGAVEEFTVIILDIHWDSEIGRITAPYGSDISAQVAEIVEAVNQQDPGYTFYCWIDSTSWDEVKLTTMPGENITVVTVVTFLKFDIFYYAGGELYHTAQASYSNSYKINEPKTAPTREGYTFAGWVYYSSYDAETGVFSDEYTGTSMANHTLYANAQWNCAHPNLECTDNGDGQTHSAVCEDCGEPVDEAQAHGAPYTAVFTWPENVSDYMEVYVSVQCACGYEMDYAYAEAELYESQEGSDCRNPGYAVYGAFVEIGGETYEDFKTYTILSDNHTALDENGFCACGGYQSAYYNEEAGVYEISNAGQLYWYARELNENNAEIHVKLTADITIPEDAPNWEPINASYVFFNGDFHTISGLTCIGDENMPYVGLFGYEGWWYEISNLHITNSHFDGSGYVGAVVACMTNGGSVTNCAVTNTTVMGDGDYVGTLAGYLSVGSVINCFVDTNHLAGGYSSDYVSIENSYYLAETDDGLGGKTAEQFASGEVAYLLQAGQEPGYDYDDEGNEIEVPAPDVWGQTIGTDSFPVLGGQKVYYGYTFCADDAEKVYTNDASATPERPDHSGEIEYVPNDDDTTHSGTYSCCGDTMTESEAHSFDQIGCCQLCGYQCAHGGYTNHRCQQCGALETFAITLNEYSVGVAIVGNPVATYGQDLTIELENIASETRDEVRVISVKIAGQYDYEILITNTLTIPGEKVVGDVEIYAQAGYVTVQVDLAGGTLLRNYAEWFSVENGIATLKDEQAVIHNVLNFGDRLVRPGYALVSLTDAEGNDWRGLDILLERDIYLTAKWECLHEDEKTYVINGDGTHDCFCANGCVLEDDVPHSYDETTLLCPCGVVSPDAVAVLSKDGTTVMAYTGLQAAVDDASGCTAEDKAVVKLLKSVDLGEDNLSIYYGAYTLDLNSFTITSADSTQGALYVDDVSDLIICNGTIDGYNCCIQMMGGKLTLIDLTLTDTGAGISVSSGEVILRQCDIQETNGGVITYDGSVAVYDSTIDCADNDIDCRGGSVTLYAGTEFPDGVKVSNTTLAAVLVEGMAFWQGNTMIALDEDDTGISGGDVTVKAACTHENATESYTWKDSDSHYVTYSCCSAVITTEPHSFGEDGICTACGFDPASVIIIYMTDDYGDGWNGSAIQVYEDGVLVDTATFDDGSAGTWMGIYDPEKEYEFYWVQGSYPDECSFEIRILEETVFTASKDDCFAYPDGYRVFPACEHVYGEGVVTDPTCTDQGYTTYTCTLCGLSYEDDYVDSLGGHSKAEGDEGIVTDPTCTDQGYTTYTCTACGESYETDYVEPLDHSKAEDDEGIVTDPTCYDRGYTTYVCTVCDESFDTDYVNPLGHTLGEDGNCSVCGELYTVPVWLADTQIDAENLTDILGDGTAAYDASTNTLTLNGYQNGEICAEIPLNIVLLGENSIQSDNYGIEFDILSGEISISGTGSLDITSDDDGINAYGDNVALTIGGSVTVNLMSDSEGIYFYTKTAALVIKDSATVIAGTEAAPLEEECYYLYGENSGSVTITGSASVTGVTNDEEGIYVGGNVTESMTISGSATVYVDAAEEGLDAGIMTISGGTVTAIGGTNYKGIYADVLTISGGTVTAKSAGQGIEAENITITGGTVTVTGGGMIATAYYVEGELYYGTITLGEGMAITAPEGAALGELDLTAEDEGPVMTVLNPDGTMADTFIISAVETPIRIIQQPTDSEGLLGESAVFTVVAEGEGLTYQWYYYDIGTAKWLKSYSPGSTTATVSPVFYGYRDGQQYRCVITDVHGNTATSEAVAMTLKSGETVITAQPADVSAGVLGRTYTFTVAATGNNLTYRWEVSTDGGVTWTRTWLEGYDTDTLTVKLNLNRDGNQYRCIVSNADNSVASEPAKLILQEESVEILTQMKDVKLLAGEVAAFQVEVAGTDLTFAWYYSYDNGANWSYLQNTATGRLTVEAGTHTQALFRCKITDGSGKMVWSDAARLKLKAEILSQPESITCAAGETATFTVAARGENLKYRWYRSDDGGETWVETWLDGYNTDTLSFLVNAGRAAKIYKCEITDADGEKLETAAVSVTIG